MHASPGQMHSTMCNLQGCNKGSTPNPIPLQPPAVATGLSRPRAEPASEALE